MVFKKLDGEFLIYQEWSVFRGWVGSEIRVRQ